MAGLLGTKKQRGLLAPSLEGRVQSIFGLQPGQDRGAILPVPDEQGGWTAPGWMYDMAKSSVLPGHVLQGGSYTPQDVTNMALDVGMIAAPVGMATAPKGAIGMNAFTQDYYGTPVKIFENATKRETEGLLKKMKYEAARRLTDAEGNTYLWDAADPALHAQMAEKIGLDPKTTIMDVIGLD